MNRSSIVVVLVLAALGAAPRPSGATAAPEGLAALDPRLAVRYVVIPPPPPPPPPPPVVFELHGGASRPTGSGSDQTDFTGGFRFGAQATPLFQAGMSFDWMPRSGTSVPLPPADPPIGGYPTESRYVTSASSDLLPLMAYVQVGHGPRGPTGPYGGLAGGYEWLLPDGADWDYYYYGYDNAYGGWAWQAWGGLGTPLGRGARFQAEIFYHGGEPSRTIWVEGFGYVEERVDTDMVGLRVGVCFGP